MDIYIPLKLSKLGKRFAFARFKKVSNVDLLIKNLRSVWLGSFHLFANVARFNRDDTSCPVPKLSTFSHPPEHTHKGSKKSFASILKDPKVGMCKEELVMVLEQDPLEYDDGLDESDKSIDLNQDWLNDKDAEVVEDSLPHQVPIVSGDPFGLDDLIFNQPKNKVVVIGDFNEVRYASYRFGSVFHASNAVEFNTFIGNYHLHDVPLGGYSYTWSDKHANKMSKLDRFLVSQGFLDLFPNISGLILHRNVSDHRPILLKEFMADYGPTPFRLYHLWFLKEDFCVVLQETWNMEGQSSQNHMVRLKNKLKALKQRLKAWSSKKKQLINKDRLLIQKSLIDIDLRLDQGMGLPDDTMNRLKLARDLDTINKKEALDLAQKAKVRWAIEGDENSKYYHGIVNKKGDSWLLKDLELANDMEVDVNSDEIKKAVWDCGPDKSPGPDGFTLDFFRRFWSIVGEDVILAVKEFFSSGVIPNGCNSSFIALIPKVMDAKLINDFRPISLVGCQYKIIGKILANHISHVMDSIISQEQTAFIKGRQIMDGPIILNEVISWCKAKKEKALFFKVDFQKAFDSVRWDHIDDILNKFRFGSIWCRWIKGYLISSKASVLVNGSPTEEFSFHRGLRQGD
nr:RNA-directed DNA polymerase, eukaryota [Tanacetum cinerariifolium]